MRAALFPKLAWTGIKKNRQLYLPYILTCIGMVMMEFIIEFISVSPAVSSIKQGTNLQAIVQSGKFVVAVFALIFLLYTNSFLNRRRNKEFGLYNILGMNKKNISRIITWESLIVSVISLAAGLSLGILFSKFAEMLLLYFIKAEANFSFSLSWKSITTTAILFAIIFAVLYTKSLIHVRHSDPLELMSSEHVGEKQPKANWVFAVLGVIILAVAYTMSIVIKSPLSALFAFLIAVIMVIVATYLLFISGSVALCKLLKKNKNYYYKKNHFVSVSSMVYRMKRNGAGLASICILSIMVLVMLASSASLYFGADDAIKARFPRETELSVKAYGCDSFSNDKIDGVRNAYENTLRTHGVKPVNVSDFRYASITGLLDGDSVNPDSSKIEQAMLTLDNIRTLFFISEEDYNREMGTNIKLKQGEAMFTVNNCKYDRDSLTMNDFKLKLVGKLSKCPEISEMKTVAIPSILFVIKDYNELKPLETLIDFTGDPMLVSKWYYGYDLDISEKAEEEIFSEQVAAGKTAFKGDNYDFSPTSVNKERDDFYITFGGLFFIGILLSIVFIFAETMIIYYKQISEGYEDKARFEIMQKVGMTERDIKKSINSQILTVFFAPLLFAGLHLGFAFPPIWKILQLFNLQNLPFVIGVTAIAFVAFGIFYAIIYKITSNEYFRIVSGAKDKQI